MKGANPLLLGQIAIHEGLITPPQLDECLRIQEAGDPPRKLGVILVERGYLTPEALEELMKIQRHRLDPIAADPERGGLFGQIALRLGHATEIQLAECLREQQDLARRGSPILLGQILLRRNYITTDQFFHILRAQKKDVIRCKGCDTLYDSHGEQEGSKFVCARCGTITQVPFRQTERHEGAERGGLPDSPGETIGRYLILEQIGQGGMGVVYKALHRDLNRTFALKILKTGDLTTFDTVRRFQREARVAARLKHEHLVAVHDAGEENGIHYIAMEYVDGEPLSVRLIGRKPRMRDSLLLMEKIIRAVAYAHAQDVVHRDLKPANIMIDGRGEPHIMDFGLAKLTADGSLLTRTGAFLGTPFYMAPEQIEGKPADPRSDVYSLGVMLYEILTARLPQVGQNSAEIFNKIINVEPPDVRELNAKVHPDLQTICMKAIQKERTARYASADAMAEDLRRHLDGEPIVARPVGALEKAARQVRKNPAIAVATAALLLLAGIAGWAGVSAYRNQASFGGHLARARAHRAAGDYDAAFIELQQALAIRPKNREAALLLDDVTENRLEAATKRTDTAERERAAPLVAEARERILRLRTRIPAESARPEDIRTDCEEAERKLEESLVLAPGYGDALLWLARARILRGDPDGAIRPLNEACRGGGSLDAVFERGILYLRRSRRARGLPGLLQGDARPIFIDPAPVAPGPRQDRTLARLDFERIATESPSRWRVHYSEAALLFLELKFGAAERKLDAYIKSEPGDPEAHALRALCRAYRMRPADAIEDVDRSLRYRPLDGFLREWRAVLRALRGDPRGALADLNLTPPNARTHCLRGTLHYRLEEFEAAFDAYDRAVETAPRHADARAGRATAGAALGRLTEADADFTRAIELEPEHARFHEDRGLLRLRAGRRRDALGDLERAVELAPGRRAALQPSINAAKVP